MKKSELQKLRSLIKESLSNPTFLKEELPKPYGADPTKLSDEELKQKLDMYSKASKNPNFNEHGIKLLLKYQDESKRRKSLKESKSCSCGCNSCGEGEGPKLNENMEFNKRLKELIKEYLKSPKKLIKENISSIPTFQEFAKIRKLIDSYYSGFDHSQNSKELDAMMADFKSRGLNDDISFFDLENIDYDDFKDQFSIKESKSCSCGCNSCGEGIGPRLNEHFKGKLITTEALDIHIKKSIPLHESKYPKNSKEYKDLIDEARYLYSRKVIDLNKKDEKLILKNPINEVTANVNHEGFPLQGHMKFQDLDIRIENQKGTTRKGVSEDGKKWETKMKFPYGYISKTKAADNEHVDCFVGDSKDSNKVFIVHQVVPETGAYDEDKVMLGFSSEGEAKQAYLDHYDSPDFFGSMTEMDFGQFKESLIKNKGKKLKENKNGHIRLQSIFKK